MKLRCGLAALVLLQLGLWLSELEYFFSDFGPLSRSTILRAFPAASQGISLHMLGGSLIFQVVLFAVQMAAALAMVRSRRPHLACLVSGLLILSGSHRAPLAAGSGTLLLSLMLLWAGFPRGYAVVLGQIGLTAGLAAYLQVPSDSWLPWLAYLGIALVPVRRTRPAALVVLLVFYALALQVGLGPWYATIAMVSLLALLPGEGQVGKPEAAVGVLALLSAAATAGQLAFVNFLPLPVRPLVYALGLQQVQSLTVAPIPGFVTRLVFQDGSRLELVDEPTKRNWLRRRHLVQIAGNPMLGPAYVSYQMRRMQIRTPQAVLASLDLLRHENGREVLDYSWKRP